MFLASKVTCLHTQACSLTQVHARAHTHIKTQMHTQKSQKTKKQFTGLGDPHNPVCLLESSPEAVSTTSFNSTTEL